MSNYNMPYKQIRDLIESSQIIFVDCFDTLLYRDCCPSRVLDRWFGVVSEEIQVSKQQFKDIWNIVTHIKRPEKEEASFKEISNDIYNRLLYCKNFDGEKYTLTALEKLLLDRYITIELSVLHVNIDLIKKLKSIKNNKKIILVSDFYMPKLFFEKVFLHFGILSLFERIIVSSEIGYRKSSGKLYKWIIQNYALQSENILMIGDNKNSDVIQAQRCGIQTYRIKFINKTQSLTPNKKLVDLFEDNLKEDPVSNYAFSLYLFFDRINNFVKKNNVSDIYFCSREGEFFKREFDKINKDRDNVNTHYLLVSRKATFLPSLNPMLKDEKFVTLRNSSPNISVKNFLEILGLHTDCLKDVHLNDIDTIIPNFFESDEFNRIKNDTYFSQEYYDAVKKEKDEFWKYLNTIGITKQTSKIVIVDIGWRGTIQDHLSSFFGNSIELTGLYFGLENTSNLSSANRKIGLVYSDVPYKSRFFDIFSTNHRLLERILQASHGSADHYLNGECILSTYEPKEKELYKLTVATKERISNTISTISNTWDHYLLSFNDKQNEIALLHEAYLALYSKKFGNEEKQMNGLMTMTFGTRNEGISYKTLIKRFYKMPGIEKKNKMLKMLRNSHLDIFADAFVAYYHRSYKNRYLRLYN